MTLPTDPIHPTDPHPAEHGSLATLARRGHERGAAGVLDGARADVRRHQRHRTAAAGALTVAVLAGTVGAGALVLRNEPPPVTADSAGGGPSGAGSLVTAIRVDQHDVFDRIVVDFDGEVAAPDPDGPHVRLPDTPECRGPADLDGKSVAYWGLRSAAAPTGDGLVADLSGRRIPGGPYAREVIPLCVAEGHTWLAIVVDDLQAQPPGTRLEDVAASLDRTGSTGTGVCELADQVLIDVFTWPQADDTPPSDEICPPPPA